MLFRSSLVQTQRSQPTSLENEEYPGFVDPSQLTSDVTHAAPVENSRETRGRFRGWGVNMNSLSVESLPMSERRIRPSTRDTNSPHLS